MKKICFLILISSFSLTSYSTPISKESKKTEKTNKKTSKTSEKTSKKIEEISKKSEKISKKSAKTSQKISKKSSKASQKTSKKSAKTSEKTNKKPSKKSAKTSQKISKKSSKASQKTSKKSSKTSEKTSKKIEEISKKSSKTSEKTSKKSSKASKKISKNPVKNQQKLVKQKQKILEEFKESFKILNENPLHSNNYIKTVTFLESNLYNKSHFNTLDLLADIFKDNKDYKNRIKVLNILVTDYPKNPKAIHKLGLVYKELFLEKNNEQDKEKAIDNFSNAIKINRKYEPAYKELLPLLKEEDTHTKNSLSLVMEMIRYVKKPEYYIYLCEGYFDNQYLKQSRRACTKAMKKNPDDPKSQLLYAFSKEKSKDINKMVVSLAKKYKDSFYVQFKTGLFFMETKPFLAVSYLKTALTIEPTYLPLLKILSQRLYHQGEYKESYNHYLKACILSRGGFMLEFKKASSHIIHKDPTLKSLFKKGIDICFSSIKSKKN